MSLQAYNSLATEESFNATVALLQRLKSDNSSQVPAFPARAGEREGTVKSPAVPFPIKGFQGGTRWDFEALLQRASGMVQ